jgi:serine protease Do
VFLASVNFSYTGHCVSRLICVGEIYMKLFSRPLAMLIGVVLLLASGLSMAAQLPDFRDIVKQHSPAVVKIIVEHDASRAQQPLAGQEVPEYLRRFFNIPEGGQPRRPQMATGSGFLISADGYIVTNNHVVEGASSVVVRLSDRREFDAQVIGTDPRSDLAVLKVEGSKLPLLELADNGDLEVGEWVLAIGSPFGLDYSVTAGIVSAKGRSLPTERNENYVPFIQTDVAINPGNSGGPLFNLAGEVVGVNSQIFTRSGGSIGLSFAIPVSVVRNVVTQLKEEGRVTRGWLGVTIQDVDKNLADSFGLDRPMGALIASVAPGSPADKGKLRAGDVIVSFDGNEILTSADLPHVVGLIAPGTKAKAGVMRDRRKKTLTIEVGGLGAEDSFALSAGQDQAGRGGRLGLVVETADAETLERLGVSGGVLVREVLPGSVGSEADIRPGDLITLVGSAPIKNTQAFESAVEKLASGSSVPMRLIRRGSPLFIGLRMRD